MHLPTKILSNKNPGVVYFHGGSWKSGTRKKDSHFKILAENGLAVFSVSYRFIDKASFPAQLQDCRDAVTYIIAHAHDYNLDLERIGLLGSSAGGYLASLLALSDGCDELGFTKCFNFNCICTIYAPTDFYQLPNSLLNDSMQDWSSNYSTIRKLMGGYARQIPDTYRLASPLFHVKAGAPPLLMIHGRQDSVVPYVHSLRMQERYEMCYSPAELLSVDNCNHSFVRYNITQPINPSLVEIREHVLHFFQRNLSML